MTDGVYLAGRHSNRGELYFGGRRRKDPQIPPGGQLPAASYAGWSCPQHLMNKPQMNKNKSGLFIEGLHLQRGFTCLSHLTPPWGEGFSDPHFTEQAN